jgi:predicted nuclease of predicted toxin-antitoxin system
LTLKFKVDENLPMEIATLLAAAGHDAVSVLDQGLGGQPDTAIASVCQTEGRAILT